MTCESSRSVVHRVTRDVEALPMVRFVDMSSPSRKQGLFRNNERRILKRRA